MLGRTSRPILMRSPEMEALILVETDKLVEDWESSHRSERRLSMHTEQSERTLRNWRVGWGGVSSGPNSKDWVQIPSIFQGWALLFLSRRLAAVRSGLRWLEQVPRHLCALWTACSSPRRRMHGDHDHSNCSHSFSKNLYIPPGVRKDNVMGVGSAEQITA